MHLLRRDISSSCVRSCIGHILAVAVVFTSTIFFAQTADPATANIEGFVKNLNTGQPIADVRVAMAPDVPGTATKTAVTDADGRFTIRDVAPGRYNISAARTLFFRPPRHSGATVLTVTTGQHYKDVQIHLLPTAVIAGRIMDDNRQPLRSVRVEALRSGYRDGHVVWTAAAQTTSDDRGEYRLFNLSPATYYVRATRSTGITQMGQAYYPGVLEPRDAIPLTLQAGVEIGAVDLQLRQANRYAVQLTLGSVTPNSTVTLNLQRRASPIADLQVPRFEALPGNVYRLPDVYPGSYDIVVQMASAPAVNQPRLITASARIPVNVTNDNVDLGTIRMNPSVPVTGQLLPAETLMTGLDASRLVLTLRPVDLPPPFVSSIRGAPDASGFIGIRTDGSVQFPAVAPGRYQIAMMGLPADTYLIAALEMGRDILDTGYVVTGNQGSLELVIGGSGSLARLEGVVVNARGDAVPFSTVALVPSLERRGNPGAFRTTTADQLGQFSMPALLPGDYSLFAWEEVDNGAWQNAEFLKTVENRGQAVRIQRGGQSAVNVRIIPAQ